MPFLDWVNKNQAKETPREVPYHLLKLEESYGDLGAAGENMLIQGDNLLALKALLPFYAGRVKCVAIDVPYNTKSAFEHYDDNLEHSQWLSMMYPRLVLLRDLLAEDGSIWVFVDDNEAHYLKVLMDEVFGRSNFIANVIWEKKYAPQNNSIWLSDSHDHLIVASKNKQIWRPNQLPRSDEMNARYRNLDNDPRGVWKPSDFTISLTGGARGAQYAKTGVSENIYEITTPSGRKLMPARGRCWGASPSRYQELLADNRLWFGAEGNNVPALKRFLSEVQDGIVAKTIWFRSEVGDNQDAKKEVLQLNAEEVFSTPKPEALIQRVLHLSTKPGDLVLDSFLGSGTTAAVAHKMGRRYIGVELGEHAKTHCLPRLKKVVDGEQGGISPIVGWQGGGGFSFYTLGEPAFDESGRLNAAVKFKTLAAYVWTLETGKPGIQEFGSPLLGAHDGKAYFLLYNGILGDRRPDGGNVLTNPVLAHLRELNPGCLPMVVYGETSRLGPARLAAEGITFKQIPYDVKMR